MVRSFLFVLLEEDREPRRRIVSLGEPRPSRSCAMVLPCGGRNYSPVHGPLQGALRLAKITKHNFWLTYRPMYNPVQGYWRYLLFLPI
jgi:hypothetical protein